MAVSNGARRSTQTTQEERTSQVVASMIWPDEIPETQFVPVQQALSDIDLLNQWTKPIGSAVFALPPGAPEGGWVGQTLLG